MPVGGRKMITGAFTTEEKDLCKKFLGGKYAPQEIFQIHMTQHPKRVWVEVITTDGNKHTHYISKKSCGNYEEYPTPLNDR